MREYFFAEKMKNRHTYLQKLTVLMPVAVVCLSAWLGKDYFTIDSYNWWYIVLFPSMAALVGASVGNRDKKMENRTIRVLPIKFGAVWDAKVMYGIQCMGISLLVFLCMTLAVGAGLGQFIHQVFRINPSVGEQILAVVVLFVTSLWQIPFCLFLQQIMGIFPMMLFHMGSYILLSVELSLRPFFMALPGGITARLMCIILKILPNGLVAEPGSVTFAQELLEWRGLPVGIVVSVLWFLLFWRVGRKWFERQVER